MSGAGRRGEDAPRASLWERVAGLVFRLYPRGYQDRHGRARRALVRELLGAERDPRRRRALARSIAGDAVRTLPAAWAGALAAAWAHRGTVRGWAAPGGIAQDVRHSFRSFVRRPAVPLVAVLSIALGIGFNATVFSAVNALVLRAAPGIADPERVVEIGRTNDGSGFDSFSYADMLSLREGAVPPLEHVAAWRVQPLSYGGQDGGERVGGMAVSAGYFEAMGVVPALGRAFLPEEDVTEGPAVAVLSDDFWRTRLAADPAALGRTILVNRVPVTVVGVAPPGFGGHFPLIDIDVWLPFAQIGVAEPSTDPRLFEDRGFISHQVVARLAEGATLEQANAAVSAVMARVASAYPDTNEGRGAVVARLSPIPGGRTALVKAFLGLLMGLVGLVLLVAAANVAGVLLARAAEREKETAVRLAIGSGRARLVRRQMVETLLLAVAGAAAGMLLASWATSLVTTIQGPGLEITLDLRPDRTVFLFALALAVATGLFVGFVPALQTFRRDLLPALADRGGPGVRALRARRTFVGLQVGAAVVLLAAGGLLARALAEASRMSGGFDPEGIHMISLDLALDGYADDRVPGFQTELRDAVLARPGVEAAALAIDLPLDLSEWGAPVWPDGGSDGDERGMGADFNAVSPGYFETLRIPMIRGRDFTESDRDGAAPVVIVSEALARRAWGEADPIGRTLRWSEADDAPRTVIGLVGEVKNQTLGESEDGWVYLPLAQRASPAAHLLARGPAVDGRMLRSMLLAADPRLTLSEPQTLEAVTAVSLLPSRVAAAVAGLLGALALFLASLGVYGVVAHAVAQRRREIGVRIALGARGPEVLRMTIAGALRMAAPGLVLGALGALGVAQLLRSLLLGISPADPVTFAAVVGVLLAAVVLASWIPGRRAARVDPMEALRAE